MPSVRGPGKGVAMALAMLAVAMPGAMSLNMCKPADIVSRLSSCNGETLASTHEHDRDVYFFYPTTCNDTGSAALPRPAVGLPCDVVSCPAGDQLTYAHSLSGTATRGLTCAKCPSGTYTVGGGSLTSVWTEPLAPAFRSACYGYKSGQYMLGHNCAPWRPEGNGTHMMSGSNAGNHRMFSVLQMTVGLVRDGYVLFRFKVDAEESFDGLRFLVNDEISPLGFVSTALDWRTANISLPRGSHSLKWEYVKDFALERGLDYASLQMVQVVGTEWADTECEPCLNVLGPGCTLCGANTYHDTSSFGAAACKPCPAGTYSFEGSASAASCRPRAPCAESDYYRNFTSCGADGKRRMRYEWALPKVCNETAPGAVDLPDRDNRTAGGEVVDCAPCDPGTERDPATGECAFCPAGTYSADGRTPCQACGAGSHAALERHYTSFATMPAGFSTSCSANSASGECPPETRWRAEEEFLTSGLNHLRDADVTLSFPVTIRDSGGTVRFTYSLLRPIPGRVSLLFYVDSVTYARYDNEATDPTEVTFPLPPGEHKLQWIYRRSLASAADPDRGTVDRDDDRARVHEIVVTGTATGGASACGKCPAGTRSIASAAGGYDCGMCPVGTEALEKGSMECAPCRGNTFAAEEGTVQCTACGNGTVVPAGPGAGPAVSCEPPVQAPAFTSPGANGTTVVRSYSGFASLAAADASANVLRGPVPLAREGEMLFFGLGRKRPAEFSATDFGSVVAGGGSASPTRTNATSYAIRVRARAAVPTASAGTAGATCEGAVTFDVRDAGSFAEVIATRRADLLASLAAGERSFTSEGTASSASGAAPAPSARAASLAALAADDAAGSAAGAGAGDPLSIALVYRSGDTCTAKDAAVSAELATVVLLTCPSETVPARELSPASPSSTRVLADGDGAAGDDWVTAEGRIPPGDIVFADNCTAVYEVLDQRACADCAPADYDVSLTCGSARALPRVACAISEESTAAAITAALARAGYASVSDIPCSDSAISEDLEKEKSKVTLLAAVLVLVAAILVVIGVLLHRLRKRHGRTQRELKKYLDQYGDSLLDDKGEANDLGESESDEEQEMANLPNLNHQI